MPVAMPGGIVGSGCLRCRAKQSLELLHFSPTSFKKTDCEFGALAIHFLDITPGERDDGEANAAASAVWEVVGMLCGKMRLG